jgi:type IV secretion system protein VirB10
MSQDAATLPQNDIRPVVRLASQSNNGMYAFFGVLLIGGFWLFSAMSAAREETASMPVVEGSGDLPAITSPPPLRLPLDDATLSRRAAAIPPIQAGPVVLQRVAPDYVGNSVSFVPALVGTQAPLSPSSVAGEVPGPRVVFEQPRYVPPPAPPATPADADAAGERDRVEASRLANPDMTVPQGTVIAAVLETAFDSTHPGSARALVQRDIYGFDGSRILIPRGSRLYGTYATGLDPGERRAIIQWNRLVRPDGVMIALDSPASDPLGRAGITGDVDSRFLARFGGALLQSVLDIGVGLATREVGNGVILALPGSTQNIAAAAQNQQISPVLRVAQGTSVSVFVARDLDFSSVE